MYVKRDGSFPWAVLSVAVPHPESNEAPTTEKKSIFLIPGPPTACSPLLIRKWFPDRLTSSLRMAGGSLDNMEGPA